MFLAEVVSEEEPKEDGKDKVSTAQVIGVEEPKDGKDKEESTDIVISEEGPKNDGKNDCVSEHDHEQTQD